MKSDRSTSCIVVNIWWIIHEAHTVNNLHLSILCC